MLKSVKKPKTIIVKTISRGAPRVNAQGVRVPGNMLLNGQWFSGIEFRNLLLGAELPQDLPFSCFMGATASYSVVEVTQELIDAGKAEGKEGHVEVINGREITYKKPGTNNVELNWDWSTIQVRESEVNLAKIKSILPSGRLANNQPAPVSTPRPAQTRETIVDDVVEDPIEDEQHVDLQAGENNKEDNVAIKDPVEAPTV